MDNIEKGYTVGIILGVVALALGALVQNTVLMLFAFLPIWLNAILLQRYRGRR